MEAKLKERLQRNDPYGIIKNVEAIYQRMTKKTPVKASGVVVASSTPYEISEACKAHRLEVELKRSQALAEAKRPTRRAR